MRCRTLPIGLALFAALSAKLAQSSTFLGPSLVAHRGSPVELAAHTLPGYADAAHHLGSRFRSAHEQPFGIVDLVEPDLVLSKDGALLCHHSPFLDDSTNILQLSGSPGGVFDARKRRTVNIPGLFVPNNTRLAGSHWLTTGFFTFDFTAEELSSDSTPLRVVQYTGEVFADRPRYLGTARIPRFREALDLVLEHNGRHVARTAMYSSEQPPKVLPVGIEPELKHPGFFNDNVLRNCTLCAPGTPLRMEDIMLRELADAGVYPTRGNNGTLRVVVQCFQPDTLRYLKSAAPALERLLLIGGYEDAAQWRVPGRKYELRSTDLDDVATFATALGLKRSAVLPGALAAIGHTVADPSVLVGARLVRAAHERSLSVQTWTFRDAVEEDPRLVRLVTDVSGCVQGVFPQLCGPLAASVGLHLAAFNVGVDAVFSESLTAAEIARQYFMTGDGGCGQSPVVASRQATVLASNHDDPTGVVLAYFVVGIAILIVATGVVVILLRLRRF
jgi:glycerophosphoryl diester phosphodiesterase